MLETIDLRFQGQPQVIASYVLRGPRGVALVETGPASTYANLTTGLRALGIELSQISDILVTHIHLDHAGAAGWLARESGATVHAHHIGAPHLVDPTRLLASAGRIYGDQMGPLWGETVAVPAGQMHPLQNGDVIEAAGLHLQAVDTPGHAYHHIAYLLDGLCFTGDVAGVRLPGQIHVRLPTPPPEIDLPAWRASLAHLRSINPDQLLPTHFGPLEGNGQTHLQAVDANLVAVADFVRRRHQAGQGSEIIVPAYEAWMAQWAEADGADEGAVARYEVIVPSEMCVNGLLRYLRG
jgi:glyoxylase-like metal-dependent hydrolase (beta-lactamase superfamily II)